MKSIILTDVEVRAVQTNGKVQVRRPVKTQPKQYKGGVYKGHIARHTTPYIDAYCSTAKTQENPRGMSEDWFWWTEDDRLGPFVGRCPFGRPGEQRWVREAFSDEYPNRMESEDGIVRIKTDAIKWKSSTQMPRDLSRYTLEVIGIRCEQLKVMTEADVLACGLTKNSKDDGVTWKYGIADRDGWPGYPGSGDIGWYWQDWDVDPLKAYRKLWGIKYAKKRFEWDEKLWTWVGEFKVVK